MEENEEEQESRTASKKASEHPPPKIEEDLGGCEVEEMRDDTVMNKCKNMLFDTNTHLKSSLFEERDNNFIILEQMEEKFMQTTQGGFKTHLPGATSTGKFAAGEVHPPKSTEKRMAAPKNMKMQDDSLIRILPFPVNLPGGEIVAENINEIDDSN